MTELVLRPRKTPLQPGWGIPEQRPLELTVEELEQIPALLRNGRNCGDCTQCCTTMGVGELGKPAHMPCMHISKRGCEIYQSRPPTCKVWSCGWLLGMGPPNWRPDKVGFVLNLGIAHGQHDSGSAADIPSITLRVDPNTPAAWKQLKIIDEVKLLSKKALIVVGTQQNVLAVVFKGQVYELTEDQQVLMNEAGCLEVAPGLTVTHDPTKMW